MPDDSLRLDVFQVSEQLAEEVARLVRGFADRRPRLCDQLRRCSSSVLLNLAEGLGRITPGEKRRAFAVARGEAIETRAALRLAQIDGLVSDEDRARCDILADRASAMLWKLIQRYES